MVEVFRHLYLAEEIVFLDGMNGTGKSILGPILGAFDRVEKQALNHTFEHICILHYLKKIEEDATAAFLGIYSDLAVYNSMISREVNMRPTDDSGIFNNPFTFRYLKRLFEKDGASVAQRIKSDKPILQIMTHQMFPTIEVAFRIFGNRLKLIEMVRHPIYMIDHWLSYIDRYGEDPRELNIWIKYQENVLPWFAFGWENKFARSNSIEKVIYSITYLYEKLFLLLDNEQLKNRIYVVPFEKLVLNPYPIIENLEMFLGTKRSSRLASVLKRQKCPRVQVTAGRGKSKYAWSHEKTVLDEYELQGQKWEKIKNSASKEAVQDLENICKAYEKRFYKFDFGSKAEFY